MKQGDLLPDLVDQAATRAPESIAIRFLDRALSYLDLAERSNQLAHALRSRGVQSGDRVGILMTKSEHSAVALYGIMKAGAAYVPIDPSAPAARQEFVVRDCGIRCLITSRQQAKRLRELEEQGLTFDGLFGLEPNPDLQSPTISWGEVAEQSDSELEAGTSEDDLAYIMYTSGSTGTPKGIMHTHRSGLQFARWAAAEYGLHGDDRLSNHAPLHFDLSTLDFFAGAAAGAATTIISEAHTRMPASYTQVLQDDRITVLYTVPFALIQMHLHGVLEQRDLSALRWAIFGGESLSPKYLCALMKRLPHVKFDNIYGPAEVNGCTHFTIPGQTHDEEEPIPIGPLNEISKGLIVDTNYRPVARGDTGELLVCTSTMMRGYWERPDLDAKAFHIENGETYYRTGDLVRELADGNLVFVGRCDRQVKARGYRVELDEVEAALVSHEAIAEAAAFAMVSDGESRIEAAATVKAGHKITSQELRAHAISKLPWYALPATIKLHPEFPRTTTGKIDRRALHTQAELAQTSASSDESAPR